ncbi:RIP metalloprotease RseP [Simiduia agarivorans]|uniref:Zinc metalloprotease n=1 Tax=Simiduia agarivorans (strain DSM 21679 / JCM 13881 / BCRC 17597 / SA1) TaxID=1117647 RepID=K4KJT0_SIMAS|nr:RIP metalloprotease RseP [Simiduia agarivorans]AFU98263.1 putative membrane-associated zinc metalloprotease [Simiduia agarivorans SA1 = DSM 21679]
MALLQTIVWFVVALGILVTIHEYGHYWVARRCGVKVLRFSVGFGKPLWRWYNREGTEFCIAAIPLGGYVKMLDEREGDVPAELLDQAFTRKPVLARIAVVAAGPVANFLLAILLFWWMVMPGVTHLVPVIDAVEPGSVAARAGLEPGQEIIAVDGVETPSAQALNQRLLERLGETGTISFTVTYPNSTLQYTSEAELNSWLAGEDEPRPLEGIGIKLFSPKPTNQLGMVVEGGPADRAGLVAGDRVVLVNGEPVSDWQAMADVIEQNPGREVELTVEREVEQLNVVLIPDSLEVDGRRVGRIGVGSQAPEWPEEYLRRTEYNLVQGLWRGIEKTGETSWFVLLSVKKLLVGEISTKNLSGPITIAKVAGASAQAGLAYYVGFLALLSVSLGVFNLLPIPVLDGGHLLYYTIELVKGSPVSERIQMLGYQVGLLVVLGVMMLAIYNDIMRHI